VWAWRLVVALVAAALVGGLVMCVVVFVSQ
jgi:uncharacterized integral membrane protein